MIPRGAVLWLGAGALAVGGWCWWRKSQHQRRLEAGQLGAGEALACCGGGVEVDSSLRVMPHGFYLGPVARERAT